jgi:zinc transporter ZupT
MHLMPDAEEKLSSLVGDYPLSNLLTAVGIVIVLSLQQITIALSSKSKSDKNEKEMHDHLDHHDHHETKTNSMNDSLVLNDKHNLTDRGLLHDLRSPSQEVSMHTITAVIHDHDHGIAAFQDLMNAKTLKDLVNAYALEISTTVHSLVIGFNLGIMDDSNASGIATLMTALAFHQFVEGIGMGSVINTSRGQLGQSKIITFVAIFSCTISVGVFIGILASSDNESDAQLAIEGSVTAIAAGSLMYIALTELVSSYFNDPENESKWGLKAGMLVCFSAGIGIMALIGIWA